MVEILMNRAAKFLGVMGTIALCGLVSSSAFAQQASGNSAAAKKQQAAPDGWFKICEIDKKVKKQICAMNFQVKTDKGQAVASIRVIELKGVDQKVVNIIIPPGLLIQPGIRIQIDKTNKGTAKFQICSQQACIVEARLSPGIIGSMKRGNQMNLIGLGQNGKQVVFPATLTGFTAAYDGDPVDPKVLAAKTETLQERLQRRADEARQRLLDNKKKEAGSE